MNIKIVFVWKKNILPVAGAGSVIIFESSEYKNLKRKPTL